MTSGHYLVDALEEREYVVLAAIGFGTKPDGNYSCKIAAHPILRTFTPAQFDIVVRALVRMYEAPLDDLELKREEE